MATFEIKHRYTGAVLFSAELSAEYDGAQHSVRLGAAVKLAVKARANLADANIAGANLAGANLADAYLAGANLARANLARANLARANLAGADLARANLARANLAGANLAGANLAGANLADAYLADAYLAGADLAGAKWRDGIVIQRRPLQLYGLDYPVTILDAHMQIGCELHTIEDWSSFDDRRIAKMDGARAVRFWTVHKAALLAMAASDGRRPAETTPADAP